MRVAIAVSNTLFSSSVQPNMRRGGVSIDFKSFLEALEERCMEGELKKAEEMTAAIKAFDGDYEEIAEAMSANASKAISAFSGTPRPQNQNGQIANAEFRVAYGEEFRE